MNGTTWQKPSPRVVWRAIRIYLTTAYGPGAEASAADPRNEPAANAASPDIVPSAVRARLETLRSTPDDSFYESPVFERPAPKEGRDTRENRDAPARFALRLGNPSYPHMKLMIERSPDGKTYLLRADTHDAHVQPPPGSRDRNAFAELVQQNRLVADAIEAEWEKQGLPTFKNFLRADLERRKAEPPVNSSRTV